MECEHDERGIIDDPTGGRVCTNCGVVLDACVYDEAPRSYDDESSTGGHGIERAKMCRVERQVFRSEKEPEFGVSASKLHSSKKAVGEICNALRLQDNVRRLAEEIHVFLIRAKEPTGGFRGHHFILSAASATYFACICRGVSRGEVEFAANAFLSRSHLTTMNKTVRRMLVDSPYGRGLQKPLNPMHLVPRFIAALCQTPGIVDDTKTSALRRAMEDMLADDNVTGRLEGRTPECICAAIAVAGVERVLQKTCDRREVALRCGVSLASINAILRSIVMK